MKYLVPTGPNTSSFISTWPFQVHLSSPILDPPDRLGLATVGTWCFGSGRSPESDFLETLELQETWQPASPFKADLEQATLAEAIFIDFLWTFDLPRP